VRVPIEAALIVSLRAIILLATAQTADAAAHSFIPLLPS